MSKNAQILKKSINQTKKKDYNVEHSYSHFNCGRTLIFFLLKNKTLNQKRVKCIIGASS